MTTWPVPDSRTTEAPLKGPGSYWEDRGDRRHCGVDIYAPVGCDIIAIAPGKVIRVSEFTTPDKVPYWNVTHEIIVDHDEIGTVRYAELGEVFVRVGSAVDEGQHIGSVGLVLNASAVDDCSPGYIREIVARGATSMLHLELHDTTPEDMDDYLGGNWFGMGRHPTCKDPTDLLDERLLTLNDLHRSWTQPIIK